MTPIADMVEKMLSGGIPPEFIVLAVRTAEQTARDSMPVDVAAYKRRAWDRERKQKKVNSTGIPQTDIYTSLPSLLTEGKEASTSKNGECGTKRRRSKVPLSADWQPDREFARSRGWPDSYIDIEAQRFRDHAAANGRIAIDWPAAWRNWVTSPYQKKNGKAVAPRPGSREDVRERNADAYQKLCEFVDANADDKSGSRGSSEAAFGFLSGPKRP